MNKDISCHKRIILVGKVASEKNFARKLLIERNFKYAISYTIRPPRNEEINGIDYFFLSKKNLKK